MNNQSIRVISIFVVLKNEGYSTAINSVCCAAIEGIFRDNRLPYAPRGLKKFKAKYQSDNAAFSILKLLVMISNAKTINCHIIVNRKKTNIAPPIAVDLFLNKHDKKIPMLKKTSPTSIVAPINMRYSSYFTSGTLNPIIIPAMPNPMSIVEVRTIPRPKNFPKTISSLLAGNERSEFMDPFSISPMIAE